MNRIDILDLPTHEWHRSLSYDSIREIVIGEKVDTEITIKTQKSKKAYYSDERADLLSVLFAYYKPKEYRVFEGFIKWNKKREVSVCDTRCGRNHHKQLNSPVF